MFAKKACKKVCEQQIHDRYSSQPQNMHQNANNGELKSHMFLQKVHALDLHQGLDDKKIGLKFQF